MMFGLCMLSFSLFHMTNFDLNVDFHTVMMARVYQAMGLAFLFVPINTAAYSALPREKNNAASGLMNLAQKYRRQCRNFACHHGPRSARTVSSVAADGESECHRIRNFKQPFAR